MPRPVKIDFVSDVACPWCAIGLHTLETALARVGDVADVSLHFQPFELNPDMPLEGQNVVEHLGEKYGSTAEQQAGSRAMITQRAADVGFVMAMTEESRMYNTFDAHRLLHWAGLEGHQQALKHALFEANFSQNEDVSAQDILVAAALKAGLDGEAAREVLNSGRFAAEVRDAERLWQSRGINGVPAVIIDERYLVSGAQPAEAYEQVLRQIAAEAA